jgi:hypothetical protein
MILTLLTTVVFSEDEGGFDQDGKASLQHASRVQTKREWSQYIV